MVSFQSIVKQYLKQIQTHQANLNSLNRIIQREIRRGKRLVESDKQPPFISYSHLVMSDLTGPTDSGWEINYSSGLDSTIKFEDYENELSRILQRECGYSIAQCYERFETFLKDSLALHLHIESIDDVDKALVGLKAYKEFKQGIRNIKTTNNKKLFQILRKTCPTYKTGEIQNNLGCNLYQWHKVFSLVRHSITHQSGLIKASELTKIQQFEHELLQHYFPGDYKGDVYAIKIPLETARSTIKRIAEIGFTIFKSLCVHHHKPWMILQK